MTAVEYLEHMWTLQGAIYLNDIEKALEMEKEQIIDFAVKFMMQDRPVVSFYNETFKSE